MITRREFGIFRHFSSLSLRFDRSIQNRRVWPQDLASARVIDISSHVTVHDDTPTILGTLIDRVGTDAATRGDLSAPGMVLAL
jgi:hypothetical protein